MRVAAREPCGAAERELALRALSRSRLLAPGPRAARPRSLSALRGRPAVVLFWATRGDRVARGPPGARPRRRRPRPGRSRRLALALDAPEDLPKVRAAAAGVRRCPWSLASAERRPELRDPLPPSLHEPAGPAAADGLPPRRGREGREGLPRPRGRLARSCRTLPEIEAPPAERLARALPFAGTLLFARRASATTFPTAGSCSIRASRPRPSSPSSGRRRGARAPPPSTAWAPSSRRAGSRPRRRPPSSGRSRCSPTSPRPATTWARSWRRSGDLPAAIARFRAALAVDPRLPRRAQQPRLCAPLRRAARRRRARSTRRP